MDELEGLRSSLDGIKRVSQAGVEYWMARDLQEPLGYARWENFEDVIEKARMACESTGTDAGNHFRLAAKVVEVGSGAKRKRKDWYVSRYAAYLIAMNGDTHLPQIALAQRYFAVQTRKQELTEQFELDDSKRLELRDRVRDANRHLNQSAKEAGVQSYALFHDAGYRGLYGLRLNEIKTKKGISEKENLLDRAGRAELAANEFRITQTEEALIRNQVKGEINARETHRKVGAAVRDTIWKLGGKMPEDLPAEPSIKKLTSRRNKQKELQHNNNRTEEMIPEQTKDSD